MGRHHRPVRGHICDLFAAVTFKRSGEALVRERRITFELGVLAQLAEFASYHRA
jgi:hypothetical protein